MKKVLIIYPHFPPSNLAGVHRPRLFVRHLPAYGWEPTVLTVHEKYYEEDPDWNLVKLLPQNLRIEKVPAFRLTRPRIFGDIGLRAFFQLYKRAKQLVKDGKFDFVYIPIPSFYCALLGRLLLHSTGVKYGIDYIDPWVHDFPGSDKKISRHWFSKQIAKFLEPIAVKKASLITGVAEGYYKEVLERNPHIKAKVIAEAMPYGGEQQDHVLLNQLDLKPYLFEKKENRIQLVYAGAMLPKAYGPLEAIFKSIEANQHLLEGQAGIFGKVEFYFIGTGSRVNDDTSYTIKPLAEKYGLWHTIVFEYPKRIPYLDVLVHLQIADGVFILGSTEPHYTPSKVYQAVLSNKPILGVLHTSSTASRVITESHSGIVLKFNGEAAVNEITNEFPLVFRRYVSFMEQFVPGQVDTGYFEQYSADAVTHTLARLLDKVIGEAFNKGDFKSSHE